MTNQGVQRSEDTNSEQPTKMNARVRKPRKHLAMKYQAAGKNRRNGSGFLAALRDAI